ncbi:unnamed protein product [Prorocentrum cordatum]|uniref:Uncharacterized protein n=1 Tax=Prorocentrum cordatum TaxID=2364126 RepID=A0ABN9SYI3_9DINO|nr:unnamed protein product [Polarella glacialis]
MSGLPRREFAARLNADDRVDERILRWLLDPQMAMLPRESWPSRAPRAKMHVQRPEEWYEVAGHLYQLGILSVIDKKDVFAVDGELVLSGALAVSKRGDPLPGESRVTRFIMNMVPNKS